MVLVCQFSTVIDFPNIFVIVIVLKLLYWIILSLIAFVDIFLLAFFAYCIFCLCNRFSIPFVIDFPPPVDVIIIVFIVVIVITVIVIVIVVVVVVELEKSNKWQIFIMI